MFKRIIEGKAGKKGCKFPPELKSFALTLQFYSSKAYEFVRKSLNNVLPCQSQVRKWYSNIPADPGFTEPAFKILEEKATEMGNKNSPLLCALMLDEMSIKKNIQWTGLTYLGFVDLGNGASDDDDSAPLAKDALVFMVVHVNGSWKVPCAYFLIDGLNGQERANLVQICIQRLADVGVRVVSLTCDGPSCHFSMLSHLGTSITMKDCINGSFKHPSDPSHEIHVLLDVCHMLKLVRNTLGEKQIFIDENGSFIRWHYIVELQKLQESSHQVEIAKGES